MAKRQSLNHSPGGLTEFARAEKERCPGCGGLVVMPCQACRLTRKVRHPSETYQELVFDLKPEQAERLELFRRTGFPAGLPIYNHTGTHHPG